MKSSSFRFREVEQLKDYQKRSRVCVKQLIENFVISCTNASGGKQRSARFSLDEKYCSSVEDIIIPVNISPTWFSYLHLLKQ